MRIGIGLPAAIPGVDSSTLTGWAVLAEQRGFDAIGVVDHVSYGNHEPLLVLAAAATVTERVELLTDIRIAPLRPTAMLAKQAATLDRLSRGRLTLGVGLGGRTAGLDAQLEQLRRLWNGTTVGPEPAQPGGPPILVSGHVPAAIDRAARLGDGWTAGVGSLNQFKKGVVVLEQAWQRYDRIGRPRVLAMTYFALGEGTHNEHEVLSWLDAYRAAGAEEVLLVPTDADLRQVNVLADAVASWRQAGLARAGLRA